MNLHGNEMLEKSSTVASTTNLRPKTQKVANNFKMEFHFARYFHAWKKGRRPEVFFFDFCVREPIRDERGTCRQSEAAKSSGGSQEPIRRHASQPSCSSCLR